MIAAWFGPLFRDIVAVTFCAGFVGVVLALIAIQCMTWYRNWWRKTPCAIEAQRRTLKPAWENRPAPLPADYDFPPPTTETDAPSLEWSKKRHAIREAAREYSDSTQSFVIPPRETP